MPHPLLGFWFGLTGFPASTASIAARRSLPVRRPAAGPRIIQLPPVHQLPFPVEKEKIWGARRVVSAGDILRLIEQNREPEPAFDRHLLEPRRGILRISHRVIRRDRDDP